MRCYYLFSFLLFVPVGDFGILFHYFVPKNGSVRADFGPLCRTDSIFPSPMVVLGHYVRPVARVPV